MSKFKTNFGKRLRELRLDAVVTQEQLAEVIRETIESVSNMERGIYGPKFENIEKIALALDVPVKSLFDF